MAYNVVKGKVGSIVGKDVDQEVGGNKTFINPVSAHGFYDAKKQSEVATMDDIAVAKVRGTKYGGLVTFSGGKAVQVQKAMHFNSNALHVPILIAGQMTGSAIGLTDIPVESFVSCIPAKSIKYGRGLRSVSHKLQVKSGAGIEVSDKGVSVDLSNRGGLSFDGTHLVVDARRVPSITQGAQNLHDNDVMLVQDSSRGDIRNTTLSNLYESYLKTKVPHAEGGKYNVQFRGNTGFAASPNFRFEPTNNILAVNGQVNTNTLLVLGGVRIEGAIHLNGAVVANVTTVAQETYEVQPNDYTILGDTTNNIVTITLPPAMDNAGRLINIKKINSHLYRLNTNKLIVKVEEGKIDSSEESLFKMNNVSRVFQSDGNKWWIIASRGS